jgi:tripartite-type tricarboxylate transporter receptor subunit TctC
MRLAIPSSLLLLSVVQSMNPVVAQPYPSRPVTLMVPFAPGGGGDIVARMLAAKLTESLGNQVNVENRPGAGTVVASEVIARSPPDGHRLILHVNSLAANHTLYKKLPYDTLKDFTPIVLVGETPNVLVVHPSLPVQTMDELVQLAKRRPGDIAYASSGTGGTAYLATEMFKLKTGTQMLHVPYNGTAPALIAILSGEAQVSFSALPGTMPNLNAKRLRALGVTSAKRSPTAPELPTLMELGLKDFRFTAWYGVFSPAGVNRDIVNRINTAVNRLLGTPEFRNQLGRQGVEPLGGTVEEFAKFFTTEVETLGTLIRASGATAD